MSTRLITPGELLQAPTGISWSDISESGGSPTEAIEQSKVIDRASAIASRLVFGQYGRIDATTDTELARLGTPADKVWVDRDGLLWFKTDFYPVASVSQLQWAVAQAGIGSLVWNQIPTANLQLIGEGFRVGRILDFSQDWTWLRRQGGMVQATYVDGWPNTYLTAAIAAAGSAVSVTVETTLGMSTVAGAVGNQLYIADAVNSEWVTVQSITDSTHFVAASVAHAHAAPAWPAVVGVSAIPDDIKEAVILLCIDFARVRGSDALVMGGGQGTQITNPQQPTDAFTKAKTILSGYSRRI